MVSALLITSTTVLWGLAALYDHSAAHQGHPLVLSMWQELAGIVVVPVAVLIDPHNVLRIPDIHLVAWSLVAWVCGFGAWWTYMLALRTGPQASGAVALVSSYPLVSLVLLVVFFAEPARSWLWIGTVLICAGAFLVQRTNDRSGTVSPRLLLYSGLSSACWGVWAVSNWRALSYGTPMQLVALAPIISLLLVPVLAGGLRARGISRRLAPAAVPPMLTAGVFYAVSTFTFYKALAVHAPGYVIALTASYPLVTLIAACLRRAERFTLSRLTAVAVLIGGVVLLQISSG